MCHYHDAKGDQCDGCGKLINAPELINAQCTTCNASPELRSTKHIFIDLPKIQPEHEKWAAEAQVKGKWTANSISFTQHLLDQGLIQRCITRDLKWGTPIPLEEYSNKVFYVWFDAPIGYISITANYDDQWKEWWLNPANNVELYQFMGKDNITFHTVIFPCSLIGTGQPWTMLHHVSTTEFLNYELDEATKKPLKFSKTRGVGVFGDNAMETGIPSEVWRYYLLINRPESQDTIFLWEDFVAKNNNELLANLGNFSNRLLKFVASSFKGIVPAYGNDVSQVGEAVVFHADDKTFFDTLFDKFNKYVSLMEAVKLKDGLKVAMEYSAECNGYL